MGEEQQDSAEDFAEKIEKAVEEHYGEFDGEQAYYRMKEVFDKNVAREAMKRHPKVRGASRSMGVSYPTFRRMIDID